MRSAAAVLLALAAGSLALAGPAQASAPRFKRCGPFGLTCARVAVPLDRSGAVPGRVSLLVKRLRAEKRPRRGALFVLAGGPGQSATFAFDGDALGAVSPGFRHRDLVIYDQRGTGRSDVLRCGALERSNLFDAGVAAGRCAQRLGARRARYTSRDSVDDIESLRVALGYDKIAIYGTSYGVKVALGYALTYPAHVERLVLDSVVAADGPDPFYRPTLAAVPRVLRALCRPGCRSFTRDPLGDVARLVARMGSRGLRGAVVDARGRRHAATLSRSELFLMLVAGDFDSSLRTAYPGAVKAALEGDDAPLLRLGRRAFAVEGRPPPARIISSALFAATTCEEQAFPWARSAPPDPAERHRQAAAAAALIPDAGFFPFDRSALLDNDLLELCDRWPAAPAAPAFGPGPLPNVPVLVLEGEDDLRTPVESARAVAAQFPQAKLLVAPATGHSVLGGDSSGCAEKAFAAFFGNRTVRTSCRHVKRGRPLPPPPASLRRVEPVRGLPGIRGRALAAAALTLRDAQDDAAAGFKTRGGGLRGGRYRIDRENGVHLFGATFVPGLRVSGVVRRAGTRRQRGSLVLSGPAAPRGRVLVHGRSPAGWRFR